MDMIIMRVSIVDPGHPIMMTPGITRSGIIGAILRLLKDIMTFPQARGRTILSLTVVRWRWLLMKL